MPWLINPAQLDKFRKNQKNVIILDATYHLPHENKDAYQEYLTKHIIGARFLNLSSFNDANSPLPNMLMRNENLIKEKICALGISKEHKIIFYDQSSIHSSCRALWMFKTFGHNPNLLYILDGGLTAWELNQGKIENGETRFHPTKNYEVNFLAHYVRTLVQMKNNLHHPQEEVVDLRHPVRYAGGKELNTSLRSGHIPGSFSFPYFTMFNDQACFKPLEKIKRQLIGIGLDLNYPIVTTCGSGMSAPILNFILDLLNHPHHALYDGSWSEWGAPTLYAGESDLSERPVVTSLEY